MIKSRLSSFGNATAIVLDDDDDTGIDNRKIVEPKTKRLSSSASTHGVDAKLAARSLSQSRLSGASRLAKTPIAPKISSNT